MENKVKSKIRLTPSFKILLGFLGVILIGAFLLSLPISNKDGKWLNFIDSIFTSTSAVCVTGLTVVDTGATFTLFGQIVIMLLIQIGGLGIVALTSLLFLILGKKIDLSNRMAIQESLNRESIQGVVKFIKKVIIITLSIELVGALCLLYSTITYTGSFWKGLFSAIFMSVSAFCHAGIEIFGNETSQFMSFFPFASNVLMQLPIMLMVILGSIGFAVLVDGFKNFKNNQNVKVVLAMTGILILGGAILYMIFEWNNPATIGNMSVGGKILNSFFQSVTTRSAGIATFEQSAMTTGSVVLTMMLMLIGGAPTSTSGGIRVTTFFVLILFLFKRPRENGEIIFKDRKISINIINKALKIALYTMFVLAISIVLVSVVEGDNFSTISIIFECTSAISTTGLTMGITSQLTIFSKIIITILMFVGRVGLTTIALALSNKTNNTNYQVEYNNTDIIVG